jgi:hypothetical protein
LSDVVQVPPKALPFLPEFARVMACGSGSGGAARTRHTQFLLLDQCEGTVAAALEREASPLPFPLLHRWTRDLLEVGVHVLCWW